ncbi:MAG TPA: hypothetical protein VN577_05010 [Terriglobales bacterium]|nr:hypothetical protein [Terriglobales bacterium]
MPEEQRSDQTLLLEGARSYPQVLGALREFGRQVDAVCRSAVGDVKFLSHAMGVTLPEQDIKLYLRPVNLAAERMDGRWANVGITLHTEDAWWALVYLEWKEDKLWAVASMWFKDSTKVSAARSALEREHPKYQIGMESGEVYLAREMVPEEMNNLKSILEDILQEWARLWEQVGGLSKVLAKAAHP